MHYTTVIEHSFAADRAALPTPRAMRRSRAQHRQLFRELADEIAGYVEDTCHLHKVNIAVRREELARAIADYTLR